MQSVNPTTFLASVLFAVALSVGTTFALVTAFATPTSDPTATRYVAADRGSASSDDWKDDLAALESRISALTGAPVPEVDTSARVEGRLAELSRRIAALEGRLANGSVHTPGATATDGDTVTVPTESLGQIDLNAAIDQRLEWREEQERLQREAERNARIEEQLTESREWMAQIYDVAIAKMNTELGMNTAQIDSMRGLLDWRLEALLQSRDERIPRDQRPGWDEVNDQFTEKVSAVLTPQQMEIWNEKRLGDFRTYQRDLQRQREGNNDGGNRRGR